MLANIFVFIIFSNIFILGKSKSFICYHGESFDTLATNVTTIYCPSGKYIMFSSACNTYWATSCYNDKRPMALTAVFRNVRKYYNVSSLNNRMFSFCDVSACNYNPLSPSLVPIHKTPISFDSFLWPNLGIEKPRNTLKNGFKFFRVLSEYEKFQFIGQTFSNSKNIWIKYDFGAPKNTFITYRFDFNISESSYILKTIVRSSKKNAALQNTLISSTEKHVLKNATKPGEKLTMLLKKNVGGTHEISINQFNLILPSDLESLLLIQYGGNWVMSSANSYQSILFNGKPSGDVVSSYRMNPTFNIPKPSVSTCSANSSATNSTLEFDYIGDKPTRKKASTMAATYSTVPPYFGAHKIDISLKQNEIIEYEIRESLCPNSNLFKIQIENINTTSNSSTIMFTIWGRLNSIWTLFDSINKETETCKVTNTLSFYSNSFSFSCYNVTVYSFSEYSLYIKSNYVVEGNLQKLDCNI